MEWITLRLENSGVRNDCIPSFLTVFERGIPDQNEEGYIDLSMDDPNREDEDYSLNVDTDQEKVEYYRNDICLPVFIKRENKPKGTESLIINENIPFDRIASAPPVYVEHDVSFIINSSTLEDKRDIKVDLIAGMKRSRTKIFYYRKSNDFKLGLEKSDALSYDYKVNRHIYSQRLQRLP